MTGQADCEPLTAMQQVEYQEWLAQWEPMYGDRLAEALKYQHDYRFGYIFIMRDFLPKGVLGMLLASLFAAYMSTMSTQLNWGTSYLVNDFYLRFISPNAKRRRSLNVSRLLTVVLAIIGLYITCLMDLSLIHI